MALPSSLCDLAVAISENQATLAVHNSPAPCTSPSSPTALAYKRPKMTKREVRNLEMIEAERSIVAAVEQMKGELQRSNNIMVDILEEMKRGNGIQEQLVGMVACNMNQPPYFRQNDNNF